MAGSNSRRGGPLVALGAVMVCWIAARIILVSLDGPPAHAEIGGPFFAQTENAAQPAGAGGAVRQVDAVAESSRRQSSGEDISGPAPRFTPPPAPAFKPFEPYAGQNGEVPARDAVKQERPAPLSVAAAAGHQMMWMAALSRMPLPAGRAMAGAAPRPVPAPFYPSGSASSSSRRWSADGWLMLRQGGRGALAAGSAPATYGASQTGAVLRYRLAQASTHRPEAYLRVASALDSPRDKEAAVGLSARPLASVPLRAMAEMRLSDQSGGTRLRPAALVVTEVQPVDLPYRTRAEFYGQAGYVGGHNATAFADGQARLDRHVAQVGKAELRAGAGLWAGAQKGAARLDAGPSATLGIPVAGEGAARLGVDWRMRLAGNARPGSGVAVTLSAGF